jgi:hypothetical protein
VGDRVATANGSRATITLTDNSKLELGESTSLVIDRQMFGANSRNTKLSLFSGVMRSSVFYRSSPTPNFEVHTPNAIAKARGTEYDTSTDTKERKEYKDCRRFTQVSVYDGTVEVTNSANPGAGSVQVPAGHQTLVACALAPEPPSEISAAAAAAAADPFVSTSAGLLLGGAILVGGGAIGGTAAAGALNGDHPHKKSDKH